MHQAKLQKNVENVDKKELEFDAEDEHNRKPEH